MQRDVETDAKRNPHEFRASGSGRPSEPEPVEPPSDEPPIPDVEDLPGTPRPSDRR